MKKIFSFFIVTSMAAVTAFAQPYFNNEQSNLNYRGNELLINPAVTGAADSCLLSLGFNKQWTGIDHAPVAGQVQFQMPLTAYNGWGAWVYNETYGPQNNTQIATAFSHSLRAGNNFLTLGLSLSLLMMHEKQVAGNNPDDPVFAAPASKQFGFNAGFGAYYFGEHFYAGFSIPQLLTNDIETGGTEFKLTHSLDFGHLQYYFTGGYRFALSEKIGLMPSALVALSGKTEVGYELMLTADYKRLLEAGAGFAAHNRLKIAAGLNITKNIGLRYQFTQQFGNTYKHFGSSHFISVYFNWD